MTRYLNWKGPKGRETVDELNSSDFTSFREFKKELRRLIGEYQMVGMVVYSSSRKCQNW